MRRCLDKPRVVKRWAMAVKTFTMATIPKCSGTSGRVRIIVEASLTTKSTAPPAPFVSAPSTDFRLRSPDAASVPAKRAKFSDRLTTIHHFLVTSDVRTQSQNSCVAGATRALSLGRRVWVCHQDRQT